MSESKSDDVERCLKAIERALATCIQHVPIEDVDTTHIPTGLVLARGLIAIGELRYRIGRPSSDAWDALVALGRGADRVAAARAIGAMNGASDE